MAAPTATITGVTTADAVPTVAPHRVSQVNSGNKNRATISTSISFTTQYLTFAQVRIGGTDRTNGVKVRMWGAVCGVGQRCGGDQARPLFVNPSKSPWTALQPQVMADMLTDGEGDYTVYVDAMNGAGWSS